MVFLVPLIMYGEKAGAWAERFFGRSAIAASKVFNDDNKMTATQWLGWLLAGAGDDTKDILDVEVISVETTADKEIVNVAPTRSKVLIYHTHNNEAYEQSLPAYSETSKWRSDDVNFNIVRIGTVLGQLMAKEGFNVIHDTTDHVQNDLSTAYARSLATMLKYKTEEKDIKYFIDIHRDAYFPQVDGDPAIMVDGYPCAKFALVVGKAEGDGYIQKPEFEKTYALAKAVENELNRLVPGICKPVIVRAERFNQHVSPGCLLIEIGHNMNTIYEAEAAAEILAKALANVLE